MQNKVSSFKLTNLDPLRVMLFAKQNLKDDSNSPTFQLMKKIFAWKDREGEGKECWNLQSVYYTAAIRKNLICKEKALDLVPRPERDH